MRTGVCPGFQFPGYQVPYPRVEKTPRPRTYLAGVSLSYAASPALHQALSLDAEQVKKVLALHAKTKDEPLGPGEQAERKRKEQAEAINRELSAILKPDQWQLWKQLVLRRLALNGFVTTDELLRLAEFHEGLSLSPAQVRRFARGANIRAVLDAKQQAKWKTMIGEPLELPKSGRVVIMPVQPGSLVLAQLRSVVDPGIHHELKLTDEQKKRLVAEAARIRPTFPGKVPVQGGSIAERRKETGKRAGEALEAVARILNEAQRRRLRQIALQQQVNWSRGLFPLFDLQDVVAELKLTEKETKAIARLSSEHAELSGMISMIPPIQRDSSYPVQVELSKVFDGKVRAALAEEQRARLKELLGEEYKGGYPRPSRDSFLPFP